MVTYSDLIQIGILVVAILSLIVEINQAKKYKRSNRWSFPGLAVTSLTKSRGTIV